MLFIVCMEMEEWDNRKVAVAYVSEISVGKNNDEKIFTQCYIMNRYREELERTGKKEEKFQAVLKNAEEWGSLKIFYALMLNSNDEEYIRYSKDMLRYGRQPDKFDGANGK